MSILIKGMEMPTYCEECRLWVDRWCYATEERGYEEGMVRKKPDWCPLVEVPTPHGRLIEAEKLMGKVRRYGGFSAWSEEELYYTIKDMDTIIEAEE